jgi:hypothetical protein
VERRGRHVSGARPAADSELVYVMFDAGTVIEVGRVPIDDIAGGER